MLRQIIEKRQREREEQLKKQKIETAKKVAVTAGVSTAIGAVLGILFAPKSGKETRKDIADKTKEVAETVKEKVVEAKDKAAEVVEKVKNKGQKEVELEVNDEQNLNM
ncbi:YtxH-like protein [Anaerobranca californiensis DSM 14826]|jgi:gas vesicle protein|uniref:YtxH-like protein n=1 Tax=Anaerobranca californiensis DSM 14826 TaxID=1120989 RepID=A0A1M6LHB1_9FIRM|nr:YtxH domain-containing protein [Anaerobranca californiensis]SHJ70569.1 YtxH-like protein [Anaerobranca californiensis DSM 14826]